MPSVLRNRVFKFRAWDGESMSIINDYPAELWPVLLSSGEDRGVWQVMEWTGLLDKQGKEIYEGDIVEAWSQGAHARFEVVWRQEGHPCFILYPAWQNGEFWHMHGSQESDGTFRDDLKIIGNIFETPELSPTRDSESAPAALDRRG
jgi:hypothetical protein